MKLTKFNTVRSTHKSLFLACNLFSFKHAHALIQLFHMWHYKFSYVVRGCWFTDARFGAKLWLIVLYVTMTPALWQLSHITTHQISVSPHSSATDWECWVWASDRKPLSSCPQWMDLKAPCHNKAAENPHEVLWKCKKQKSILFIVWGFFTVSCMHSSWSSACFSFFSMITYCGDTQCNAIIWQRMCK